MIGKIVTHYKILERLGGGGMGLVYKAQDLTLDRSVALKFLPPVFSMNEDLKLKIIQEAKIAATLEHPNICNIHEVGETKDGQIFIVMAYYEGETLKKVIQNNSLNRDNLESIILQIAKGLEQAHDNEIIHRDIKPANIFLTNKNEIKILDFGVAKVDGDFSFIDVENLKGTIAYMSPEQISGEEVDQQTDIWAFGVLLYELLTGQKPFNSEYEQTALFSIMNDDVSFSDLDLDEHLLYLKKVITKCLEKNKADRFQSMKEIVELIEQNSIIQTKSKSNRFYNSTSFKLFSTTIFILIGILLIINFRGYLGWNSGENAKKRIAVFPFDCNNNGEDSIDQPILLQSILVKNLISFKEFGVIDPNSLNEFMDKTETKYVSHHNLSFYSSLGDLNISYFIDGSVTKNESDFTIKTNIIDLKTHEVSFSYENKYSDEKNFLSATEDISSQVINFFQVKIHPLSKEKDLTPWVSSECDNMLALKSFMQASQIIYRQEPGAEKYLRQALEYDSCYTSPRIWLISHLVAVGNYEEAKKHMKVLDRLEAKANPFEQAMINYTRAYINDDLSKQIQYLCVALEYSPNNNILLYSLARLYYLIGDYQKSADTISNTINMNWSFSPAYSLGGDAYYRLKKYDNAKDIFEQALNISPVYKYIYSQLSVLYLIENDTITANKYDKQFINRSKELGMTLAETYFDLAEFYFEEKFYLSANKYYKNAIKENPNNPIYHEQLAKCYNKQGDVKTAKIEFLQTINLDSLNCNSHFILGNIFLKENIKDKAKQHFISYLGIDSISPRADSVNNILITLGIN